MKKNALDMVALILLIIGGINWGLIGVGVGNVVNMILGSIPILESIVDIIIGLAGLYTIYYLMKKHH